MNTRKAIAAYSIFIGVMMASMWLVFALTNQIPELDTKPKEIAFHLAAEFITAFALIAGGIGLVKRTAWGFYLNLVALGMVSYSVIVSPGYYAQQDNFAFVGMFAVLMALTLIVIVVSIWKRDELRS